MADKIRLQESLESRAERFKQAMLAKFYARVEKHPGESSVTHPDYDWASTNLEDIEHHLIYEFLERFPQFIDRFPEVDKSRITIDDPQIEDIDMANLSMLDWIVRDGRKGAKASEK